MNEVLKGKPVFYNDFDGAFGVLEEIGGEPYILYPQWVPNHVSLPRQLETDLVWYFLGYVGEELSAKEALKVMGLMFRNSTDYIQKELFVMRDRLKRYFVISDEIFDLKVVIEDDIREDIKLTVIYNIYGNEKEMSFLDHVVVEPDFDKNSWVRCITDPVKSLYPSANIKVVDKTKKRK